MKALSYIFVIAVTALSFNLNADVAKPKSSSSIPLPAIWSSSSAQERLKAVRVAQLDAYRALLERVYGFQISSGTTIYDCALQSDQIHTRLNLLLKGAVELEKPEYNDYCGKMDLRYEPLNKSDSEIEVMNAEYDKCNEEWEAAQRPYNQYRYYIFAGIGFALLLFGLFSKENIMQLTGLAAGGILVAEGIVINLENKIIVFFSS